MMRRRRKIDNSETKQLSRLRRNWQRKNRRTTLFRQTKWLFRVKHKSIAGMYWNRADETKTKRTKNELCSDSSWVWQHGLHVNMHLSYGRKFWSSTSSRKKNVFAFECVECMWTGVRYAIQRQFFFFFCKNEIWTDCEWQAEEKRRVEESSREKESNECHWIFCECVAHLYCTYTWIR